MQFSGCVSPDRLMFRLVFTIMRLISFTCGKKRGMFGYQRKVATSLDTLAQPVKSVTSAFCKTCQSGHFKRPGVIQYVDFLTNQFV